MDQYDYSYERTDEQLLYYSAMPAIGKLCWQDAARRFTLMTRQARRTCYRDGKPVQTVVSQARELRN